VSTEKTDVQAAVPNALQDFTNCPEWGKGGQFAYDPITKTRTRIDTDPAPAGEPAVAIQGDVGSTEAAEAAPVATTTTTVKKGAARA
jgi:hypothetical protein